LVVANAAPPIVTLSSDFGAGSPYVAIMKAVLLSVCPSVLLVDVNHDLESFRPEAGAFPLWAASAAFGPGSIHLAVVDPGVGSARRAVAFQTGERWYVGPDNGLFGLILAESDRLAQPVDAAFNLPLPEAAAPTFHGRDVFAPAAALLARDGVPDPRWPELAPADLIRSDLVPARVLFVDSFGNLITSIRPPALGLMISGTLITSSHRSYHEAEPGRPFFYLGSMGLIEVGVREGRADQVLGAGLGSSVQALGADKN